MTRAMPGRTSAWRGELDALAVDRDDAVIVVGLQAECSHWQHLHMVVVRLRQVSAGAHVVEEAQQVRAADAGAYEDQVDGAVVQLGLGRKMTVDAQMGLVNGVHHDELALLHQPTLILGQRFVQIRQLACRTVVLLPVFQRGGRQAGELALIRQTVVDALRYGIVKAAPRSPDNQLSHLERND